MQLLKEERQVNAGQQRAHLGQTQAVRMALSKHCPLTTQPRAWKDLPPGPRPHTSYLGYIATPLELLTYDLGI